MAVSEMTLSDLIAKCIQYPNNYYYADQILELNSRLNAGQISNAEFVVSLEKFTGKSVTPVYSRAGNILTYTLNDTVSTTTSGISSNVQNIARSNVRSVVNTGVTNNIATTGRVLTPVAAGSNWAYIANSVASPIAAAATGISLGKLIDSTLYNLNPDFWDSNGMGSINPETWNSITMDVDYSDPVTGAAATAFNFIFGLDPENNTAQAYIDEDAYAYLAYYLMQQGVFNTGGTDIDFPGYSGGNHAIESCPTLSEVLSNMPSFPFYSTRIETAYNNIISSYGGYYCVLADEFPLGFHPTTGTIVQGVALYITNRNIIGESYNDGATIAINRKISIAYQLYQNEITIANATETTQSLATVNWETPEIREGALFDYYYQCFLANTSFIHSSPIEGITNQPNAILPNVSTWNDIPSTLDYLQTAYPDLWENAIDYDVIQPDGTVEHRKGIPVPWPLSLGNTDTQPTSGDSLQANPKVNADTSTQELIDALEKILNQPQTDPFGDTEQPPENPTENGEGSTITPTPISGSASSMWAIYHPTQTEVDDFGAWLWSPDFIDQIAKIFNNPMESIIGLHKIFATPIDAGQATIKVGYLDSEVPSAYITQQYVYVDCGTVDLFEQFGNVFDYSPYTSVNLYLPFIGIVPLDVADVMRSSISITYGVDVITGACLAMVEISRDGYNSVQYQYSGNCAVQYPISSGSYMGIVASIISVAGSIVATAASGGAAAPLALGAAGAALNAHTQVQHSGSYSGNAGAMGGKKPYLIISRPITKMADYFNDFSGYPTNAYITVGECEGFIKANEAHIINVNATEDELKEIYSLLIGGVII